MATVEPPNLAVEHGPANRTWIYAFSSSPESWPLFLNDESDEPFIPILKLGDCDRRAVVPGHKVRIVCRDQPGSRIGLIRRADYIGKGFWMLVVRLKPGRA